MWNNLLVSSPIRFFPLGAWVCSRGCLLWMFVHHAFAWYVSPSLDPSIFACTMTVLHPHMNTFIWSTNQDRFSQMPPFGHSCSLSSCKAHNQFYVGPPSYLSYRCFGTMLYLIARSQNLVLANHVVPYQLNLWFVHRFCPWSLLTSSPTSPHVSGCLSALILWFCPTWSSLMLINCLVVSLVDTRRAGIKQKSYAQSPSVIELCSLVLCCNLRITSLLTPNLVTTFACYPSLV
jgi:hypothetical protein